MEVVGRHRVFGGAVILKHALPRGETDRDPGWDAQGTGHGRHGGREVHAIAGLGAEERRKHARPGPVIAVLYRCILRVGERAATEIVLQSHGFIEVGCCTRCDLESGTTHDGGHIGWHHQIALEPGFDYRSSGGQLVDGWRDPGALNRVLLAARARALGADGERLRIPCPLPHQPGHAGRRIGCRQPAAEDIGDLDDGGDLGDRHVRPETRCCRDGIDVITHHRGGGG